MEILSLSFQTVRFEISECESPNKIPKMLGYGLERRNHHATAYSETHERWRNLASHATRRRLFSRRDEKPNWRICERASERAIDRSITSERFND